MIWYSTLQSFYEKCYVCYKRKAFNHLPLIMIMFIAINLFLITILYLIIKSSHGMYVIQYIDVYEENFRSTKAKLNNMCVSHFLPNLVKKQPTTFYDFAK